MVAGVLSCITGEASALARGAASPPTPASFSLETVRQLAAASAAHEYRTPQNHTPDYLKKLSYDDFQMIRFRRGAGPWRGDQLNFNLQFFHPGFLYQDEVIIHLIEGGAVKEYPFSQADSR